MKTQIVKAALTCACLVSLVSSVQAGRVDVVNENKKLLKVKIKAEGDNMNENLMTYGKEIPAKHHSTFEVNSADLNGKSHYSIKGDTNSFTAGGKCDHLSTDKNYKVTFLNDTSGTSCVAEEI